MGFSVMDSDGNVKSKTVFWGGMPIDVMTITKVEDLDDGETSVLVMTETTRADGMVEMRANAIEMGSNQSARKVYDLAVGFLKSNKERG